MIVPHLTVIVISKPTEPEYVISQKPNGGYVKMNGIIIICLFNHLVYTFRRLVVLFLLLKIVHTTEIYVFIFFYPLKNSIALIYFDVLIDGLIRAKLNIFSSATESEIMFHSTQDIFKFCGWWKKNFTFLLCHEDILIILYS